MDCAHKDVVSLAIRKTDDHVVLCRDCRSVIHWCCDAEDQWVNPEDDLKTGTPAGASPHGGD